MCVIKISRGSATIPWFQGETTEELDQAKMAKRESQQIWTKNLGTPRNVIHSLWGWQMFHEFHLYQKNDQIKHQFVEYQEDTNLPISNASEGLASQHAN